MVGPRMSDRRPGRRPGRVEGGRAGGRGPRCVVRQGMAGWWAERVERVVGGSRNAPYQLEGDVPLMLGDDAP